MAKALVGYLWELGVSTFCCSCKKKPGYKEREQGFELLAKTQWSKEDFSLPYVTDFGNLKSCYSDQVLGGIGHYEPQKVNGIIYGSSDI